MRQIRLSACGLAVAAAFSAPAFAAPTVKWSAPLDGATVSGYINGKSECAVSGSRIKRVQFYLDNTLIGSDGDTSNGATCRFESTQFADGAHTLKALAYDAAGKTASATIHITIKNGTATPTEPAPTSGSAPTVSFSAPAEGGTLSGNVQGPPNCTVTGNNIAKVMFYLNEQWTNTDGNLDNGLGCWIDTTKYADGSYTVKAVAYNAAGETATATRTIKIQNSAANNPPSVSITTPDAGAILKGYVSSTMCAASASDTDGAITQVEWLLGTTLLKSDSAAPYQCDFESTAFKDGTYQLVARATDDKGGVATAQREVKIQNGSVTTDPGTGGGGAAIEAADILGRSLADTLFASQAGYNGQVLGTYPSVQSIPEAGIHGTVMPNGESLRMGKQADPSNSARKALVFALAPSDPNTSGSKRSEFKFPNNIDFDQTYWTAFKVFIPDWGNLSSSEVSIFGTQLHSGDSSAGYSPSFGLYALGGGRDFTVRVRGDGLSGKIDYATQPIPFGRWVDFVFKVRQSQGSGGLLQAWMDGQQIVDHQGPIGYKTSYKDYFKYGYYNWSSFSGTRKVMMREVAIVADPTGSKYNADALRAFINQ